MESIDNKEDLERLAENLKDKIKTCALCYYDYYSNGNPDSYHGYKEIYSSLNEEEKGKVNFLINDLLSKKCDNPNDSYRSVKRH